MKKFIFLLTLASSFSAFAGPCKSLNLNTEWKKISATKGTEEAKETHFSISKNAKLMEILACAQLQNEISQEEFDFAKFELEKNRINEIEKLNQNARSYKSKVASLEATDLRKELYKSALNEIPREIQTVEEKFKQVIKSLKSSL